MLKRVSFSIVLASVMAVPLLAAACAREGPYPRTGDTDAAEQRDRARFTDDKGHYRPDWRAGIDMPPGVAQRGNPAARSDSASL